MKDKDKDKPKLVLVSESASKKKSPTDLPILTPKQKKFLEGIAKGKLSATESYRLAYDCEGMKDSSVYVESSKLIRHPKITLHLERHQAMIDRTAQATMLSVKEYVENGLKEIIEDEDSNVNAKVSALSWLGKSVAMFTDKVESTDENKSVQELEEELRRKLGLTD
tara:strand:- start:544 stop:1041 length:498 start_codon:yes stop_codon:yes gene_type:complete